MRISIPNQVTLGRLALALVFFVVLSGFHAESSPPWLLVVCFVMFLIAALGDALDGYLARTLGQVTPFGRIVDPVVDKVMVCGAFVLFAGANFAQAGRNITGVAPWMVIVILIRELLVTAIRAHAEAGGDSFAADWTGKIKMFVQSATVCVILGQLGWRLEHLAWLRSTCIWLTLLVTVLSIITYTRRAYAFLLSSTALGVVRPARAAAPEAVEPPAAAPPPGDPPA